MPIPELPASPPVSAPLRGLALSGLLVLPLLAGCAAPAFHYALHGPPRVHVHHEPLLPGPDEEIRIVAVAEPAPATTVTEVSVSFGGNGHPFERRTCPGSPCELRFAAGHLPGLALYSAQMTDSRGVTTRSASAYYFQIVTGAPSAGPNVILRAPFDLYAGRRAFKILLVRDGARADYPTQEAVRGDAQTLIYDGLLADPVYRWRDDQLAFYLSTTPGSTSDYHSGLTNRCGQLPWLGTLDATEDAAESAASTADAVVVLHRQPGWRDCAGLGRVDAGAGMQRRASAYGRQPDTFAHELGHALFGLADEYQENTRDRITRSDTPPAFPDDCLCCATDPLSGQCRPPGRDCSLIALSPECFPAAPVCPPIASSCPRPNIFDSRATCEAAQAAIDLHPGVEGTVAPTCRQLCAGASCPCLAGDPATEIWILDPRTPPLDPTRSDDDLMGHLDRASPRERHGPACARCAESRFCLAWEIGRGRTTPQAEAHCLTP